jgi:hypothetical protein
MPESAQAKRASKRAEKRINFSVNNRHALGARGRNRFAKRLVSLEGLVSQLHQSHADRSKAYRCRSPSTHHLVSGYTEEPSVTDEYVMMMMIGH